MAGSAQRGALWRPRPAPCAPSQAAPRREGCALCSQQDRQPLSDLLADELLLHLEELPLDLGQRRDIERADPSGPCTSRGAIPSSSPGAGHGGCAAGRAWFKRLRSLPASASPSSSGCRPPRREPASKPICNQPLQHGRSPSELIVQAAHLLPRGSPLQRLGINGDLQHRSQLLAALQGG